MDSEKNREETSNIEETSEKNREACDQACSSLKDQLLRVTADFQNFKNRVEKERMQYIQIGHLSVIEKILPVVDDIERALEEARKNNADVSWISGFNLIEKTLHKALEECGIKQIEQTKLFDPELHEALAQVESADHSSGEIVSVMQKGFMIGDRVLRPSRVTVAK